MLETKIVASYGPACCDPVILKKMYEEGMRVVRINTSFPSVDEVSESIDAIRKVLPHVALLIDLQGYKIRIAQLEQPLTVKEGDELTLASEDFFEKAHTVTTLAVDYPKVFAALSVGDVISIDEGKILIKVKKAASDHCVCVVQEGGEIKRRKTVNIIGVPLDFPALSDKDQQVLKLAAKKEVEFVALSFVRSVQDVQEGRALLGKSKVKIIAKIENSEGIEHFDGILEAADGIMVARGDLGVETPLEHVPLWQKDFILRANSYGKPIIIATHMMESMITERIPTRAEVSDIANAILDGTDAIMLSGETAVGMYPVKVIETMARIARAAEEAQEPRHPEEMHHVGKPMTNAIARATLQLCQELPITSILIATASGTTARAVASFRPCQPIFAFTATDIDARQLNLSYGVQAIGFLEVAEGRDVSIKAMMKEAKKQGFVKKGDMVLLVSGANIMHQGATNMLEVAEVG